MAEDMNKSAAETEEEYQPDLMTLEDEDGNEVTFEVIDALDHKVEDDETLLEVSKLFEKRLSDQFEIE